MNASSILALADADQRSIPPFLMLHDAKRQRRGGRPRYPEQLTCPSMTRTKPDIGGFRAARCCHCASGLGYASILKSLRDYFVFDFARLFLVGAVGIEPTTSPV